MPNKSDEEIRKSIKKYEESLSDSKRHVRRGITACPYVCGAAFDVEIKNSVTGKCLDFGGTMNDDKEHSFLYYPDLSDEQKTNRLMLLAAMLNAGFASCKLEWWHYSYGDQIWAWFYGEERSLYSPIDL